MVGGNMFHILSSILRNKDMTSGKFFATLHGFTEDFPPTILISKDAATLVEIVRQCIPEYQQYQYDHVIYSMTLDVWNIPSGLSGVGDCYHRNFGDLTKCPSTKIGLFALWSKILVDGNWFGKCSDHPIGDCDMCTEKITTTEKLIQCKSCSKINHLDCLGALVKSTPAGKKCPNCKVVWLDKNCIRVTNKLF
jgi:hypothetical protein